MVTVTMGNQLIEFKIDTGAEVTAITEETYAILQRPQLTPAPGLYVIKGLKTNLLGLPAIITLQKLCATEEANDKDIMDQYPEYEIKLKGEATPYVLYAARNIPIPLR